MTNNPVSEPNFDKFLGFQTEFDFDFFSDQSDFVCVVNRVTRQNLEFLTSNSLDFPLDSWFVSSVEGDDLLIDGYFDSMEVAFDFAREKFFVVSFRPCF